VIDFSKNRLSDFHTYSAFGALPTEANRGNDVQAENIGWLSQCPATQAAAPPATG
jgi:hypothetical protein